MIVKTLIPGEGGGDGGSGGGGGLGGTRGRLRGGGGGRGGEGGGASQQQLRSRIPSTAPDPTTSKLMSGLSCNMTTSECFVVRSRRTASGGSTLRIFSGCDLVHVRSEPVRWQQGWVIGRLRAHGGARRMARVTSGTPSVR